MPAKKCFIFKYKTTPDQNDEEIERLEKEISEASKQRQYAKAQKLKSQLDYCMSVREYYLSLDKGASVERSLQKIEDERQQEEDDLKQNMIEKSRQVIESAEERLKEMEQKHQEEMEQLDKKFSGPFSAVKMSSNITTMLKSEDYYAQKQDFQLAEAYKRQIAARAQKEILDTESNADSTITAAVEAILKRYDTERKGFHNHLNNQKITIIREAQNKLSYIKNKYTNLRFKAGGSSVEQLPNVREHEKVIFDAIDAEFEDIMKRTESLYASNTSSQGTTSASRSKSTTARGSQRKSKRGQNKKSKQKNDNENDNNEEETNNEEEDEFADNEDTNMTGTNEDLSATVTNPRVLNVLNRTINKNLAQTL